MKYYKWSYTVVINISKWKTQKKEKEKEVFIELGKRNFLEERKKYKDIKNIHVWHKNIYKIYYDK